MGVLQIVWLFVRGLFAGRAALAAENLALRHQLAVLHRSVKRPKLRKRDRIFWGWLSRFWPGWRSSRATVSSRPQVDRNAASGSGGVGFHETLSLASMLLRHNAAVHQPLEDALARLSTVWCDGLLGI